MALELKELNLRHREIIRLAFLGRSQVEIAGAVGMSREMVGEVLRSPLAQAEVSKLSKQADECVVNVALRAKLIGDLNEAGIESLRINRELMKDETVQSRTRARIAIHFMDRIVFNKDEGEKEGSYREILRKLDEVSRQLGRDLILVPSKVDGGNGDNGGSGSNVREDATAEERPVVLR